MTKKTHSQEFVEKYTHLAMFHPAFKGFRDDIEDWRANVILRHEVCDDCVSIIKEIIKGRVK